MVATQCDRVHKVLELLQEYIQEYFRDDLMSFLLDVVAANGHVQ